MRSKMRLLVDGCMSVEPCKVDVLAPLPNRPVIVCLCGSTCFKDVFRRENLRLTLEGKVVLSIGYEGKDDAKLLSHLSDEAWESAKVKLDALHLQKINLADEVLILNVGGYIGESTGRELAHARAKGKTVRFLEPV